MQCLMALRLGFQEREALSGKDERDFLSECPGGQGQIRPSLQRRRGLSLPRQRDEPILTVGIGREFRQKILTGLI